MKQFYELKMSPELLMIFGKNITLYQLVKNIEEKELIIN